MFSRIVTLASSLLTCVPCLAGPKEEALAAYREFFETFTTDNHDAVVRLFAPDALFYGTSSTDLVTTPGGIRRYFDEALSGTRGSVKATAFEPTAVVLSDGVVAISGKWQLDRTVGGRTITMGPLRNSVVMQKRGDRWLIVQFHNSLTP